MTLNNYFKENIDKTFQETFSKFNPLANKIHKHSSTQVPRATFKPH